MDENYKAIYRILRTLERSMDADEFDFHVIGHELLGISRQRWQHILEMLSDDGYIKGIQVIKNIGGNVEVYATDPKITLKGLEYLSENTMMKRMQKAAKGIVDLIP